MADRLNLEGLRYAQSVAESGSFSAAARAYGVTQPSLSNGIARLEDRLGERLFDRSPRGVQPTAFGTRILPLVERSLAALDAISAEANRWHQMDDANIRLGVSPLIDPRLVGAAYTAACSSTGGPGGRRELVLREANMDELRTGLVAGDLDLILIPSVAPLPRYEHRYIASEPLVVVDAERDVEQPIELAELEGRQLILVAETCGLTTYTRDLLAARALAYERYPGEASSYEMLQEWAALGLGTAVMPASKVTPRQRHPRLLHEDGHVVELFYEAVWDGESALAGELAALTERVAELAAS